MAKFRIEAQITLLTVIIAAAVVTSGYLGYKSLSQIVNSIHQEARPDYKLLLIKDISAQLSEIENNVRLYVLTGDEGNLKPYRQLANSVEVKTQGLAEAYTPGQEGTWPIDSIRPLIKAKLAIWEEVLQLHKSKKDSAPVFSEIYSKLEEQIFDTVTVAPEKKGIFRKIFGGKKLKPDTTLVERAVEKEAIKKEIRELESEVRGIKEKGKQYNVLESHLIERNIRVSEKLNTLIALAEKNETNSLLAKTNEADRLAALTYKRLAAFSVTAVALLLAVLFLLYNYLHKSRAYQQVLNEAKLQAEGLAKAKELFVANVSHEMRTPVNAIYGLAEQLFQQDLPPKTKEQISIIARSAGHLKNVVNDTLDFSRIQAQKIKLDEIHFSPTEIFDEVIAIQTPDARKKGIGLDCKIEGFLPPALLGDPMRLKQVLINLAGNAIKFTDKGRVAVNVKAIAGHEGYFTLQMIISDTGIGISKENLEVIFEEFVQVENNSSRKYSGAGLGLSIVKKLVELQGGKISVESELGKGTAITVSIPYKEGDKEKIEGLNPVVPEIPKWFKKLSALVADDEEFNRYLLKGIFEKWGVNCTQAENGNEAVAAAMNNNFDLILMDVRMPETNGIEATKKIIGNKPESRIIAITAANEKAGWDACREAGMCGFLPKPFSEAALFELFITNVPAPGNSSEEKIVPPKPQIDLNELERLTNGDRNFFAEMLEIFIRSSESGLANLREALAKNDLETISATAHKMAAPCRQLLAFSLFGKIRKLEKSAEENAGMDVLFPLFSDVESELLEINAYLKHYLLEENH